VGLRERAARCSDDQIPGVRFAALRRGTAEIRRLAIIDAVFGVVTFVGVLLAGDVEEIAAFATNPEYWDFDRGRPL
jgi:hypothetical protein